MNQVNKQHELTINISPANRSNIVTNTTFFSMDVETGKKIINFTHDGEPVDLTNATVVLGFEFIANNTSKIVDSEDGSVIIEDAKAGRCSMILPNHLYQYAGQVLVHVYILYDDGTSLDCGVIVTQFEESWLDSDLEEMSRFYIKRFEDLASQIKSRMAEMEEALSDAASLGNIDDHINNQDVHLSEQERRSLFGQLTTHEITGSQTLENTGRGLLTNHHLRGQTFVNLWSDRKEDFETIPESVTLTDQRVTMVWETPEKELSLPLNTHIFRINTTYSILVDVIKNDGESFITLPNQTQIRTTGRHLVTFRTGSTLGTSLSFTGVNPTGEIGHTLEFDLSIYEGDWSTRRFELPQTPPRQLSSAGDGGVFEITTSGENQFTQTQVEYQDNDGIWRAPVLRWIGDGSNGALIADEITETEYIQRVVEVDYENIGVRDFTHGNATSTTTRFRLETGNLGLIPSSSEQFGNFSVLSNRLPHGNATSFTDTARPGAHMVNGRLSIRIPQDRSLTAATIRGHLISNNYRFLVPLATPRRFPIRMRPLESFSPRTKVTFNSGDVEPRFRFDVGAQSMLERLRLLEEENRQKSERIDGLVETVEQLLAKQKVGDG